MKLSLLNVELSLTAASLSQRPHASIIIFPQMSTYSLNSNIPQSDHGTATPSLEQQPKLLEDALQALKQQAFHMRKSRIFY